MYLYNMISNKLLAGKIIFSLLFLLAVIFNMETSMAKPKTTTVKFDLSGSIISFSSPTNYSKDFPAPSKDKYLFNIYDKAVYTDSENTRVIRQSHWDYGKGFFFGKVKGTLSMTAVLYHTSQKDIDLKNNEDFIKALKLDFEKANSKQDIEDFGIEVPLNYSLKDLQGTSWGYYEYFIDSNKKISYTVALSDQHYLKVNFNFINNSHNEKNDWIEQAETTINEIMSSFEMHR